MKEKKRMKMKSVKNGQRGRSETEFELLEDGQKVHLVTYVSCLEIWGGKSRDREIDNARQSCMIPTRVKPGSLVK